MKAVWYFYCVPVWGPQVGGHLVLMQREVAPLALISGNATACIYVNMSYTVVCIFGDQQVYIEVVSLDMMFESSVVCCSGGDFF